MVGAEYLQSKRNESVDLAKGILIILVILGHILPGTLEENLTRYIIYTFHMPVFIAIGGYLFSAEKMQKFSVLDFFRYYFKRLILPWVVAVCVYFALRSILNHKAVGIGSVIAEFILPYYHLWYVPAFLGYAFIGYLLVHFGNKKVLIASTAIFTFLSMFLCFVDFNRLTGIINKVLYVIGYTIRPQFIAFFLLGILCRRMSNKILYIPNRGVKVSFLAVIILGIATSFMLEDNLSQNILKLIASILISLITILFFLSNLTITSRLGKLVVYMGKCSYPLYLWHVIGKIVATPLLKWEYDVLYYTVSIAWVVALVLFIRFRKNKILIDITGR